MFAFYKYYHVYKPPFILFADHPRFDDLPESKNENFRKAD